MKRKEKLRLTFSNGSVLDVTTSSRNLRYLMDAIRQRLYDPKQVQKPISDQHKQ